jgi:hypothetical protein
MVGTWKSTTEATDGVGLLRGFCFMVGERRRCEEAVLEGAVERRGEKMPE